MVSARKAFPDPAACQRCIVLKERVPYVIGIQNTDSRTIGRRRVAGVMIGRTVVGRCGEGGPVAGVGHEKAIAEFLSSGHAHKVLLRFSCLVGLDDIDDVKLPGGIADGVSIRHLIHHVHRERNGTQSGGESDGRRDQ